LNTFEHQLQELFVCLCSFLNKYRSRMIADRLESGKAHPATYSTNKRAAENVSRPPFGGIPRYIQLF